MLSKICLRTVRNFSKFRILSEHDVSNMVGLVEANPKTSMTIWEKISSLSPSSVYHTVD